MQIATVFPFAARDGKKLQGMVEKLVRAAKSCDDKDLELAALSLTIKLKEQEARWENTDSLLYSAGESH